MVRERTLTTTIVEREFMNAKDIAQDEVVAPRSLQIHAHLSGLMTKLHAETKQLKAHSREVTIFPEL